MTNWIINRVSSAAAAAADTDTAAAAAVVATARENFINLSNKEESKLF
jgi:hypothetical protein